MDPRRSNDFHIFQGGGLTTNQQFWAILNWRSDRWIFSNPEEAMKGGLVQDLCLGDEGGDEGF